MDGGYGWAVAIPTGRPPPPLTTTGRLHWLSTRSSTRAEGNFTIRLFDQEAPETVANFRRPGRGDEGVDRPAHQPEGHAALLRRHRLSPRDRRLHDPGRRPARPGYRRAGLQLRRRVPPEPAPQQGRHPVDGERGARTPTAGSSSSRSDRRRTSTTATRSSARSTNGMDVVRKIGSTTTGRAIARSRMW